MNDVGDLRSIAVDRFTIHAQPDPYLAGMGGSAADESNGGGRKSIDVELSASAAALRPGCTP